MKVDKDYVKEKNKIQRRTQGWRKKAWRQVMLQNEEEGAGEKEEEKGLRSAEERKTTGVTECWTRNSIRGINIEAKSQTSDYPCARPTDAADWLCSVAY